MMTPEENVARLRNRLDEEMREVFVAWCVASAFAAVVVVLYAMFVWPA